jgi:hypothetical protein
VIDDGLWPYELMFTLAFRLCPDDDGDFALVHLRVVFDLSYRTSARVGVNEHRRR